MSESAPTLLRHLTLLKSGNPVLHNRSFSKPPSNFFEHFQIVEGLSQDDILEFAPDFIKELGESLRTLKAAIKSRDFKTVKITSHKIKGIALCYGTFKIAELIGVIENDLKEISPDLGQIIARVEDEFMQIKKMLA